MKGLLKAMLLLGTAIFWSTQSCAADKGTAEEAVALVKKGSAYIKANGKEKALAEFNNQKGKFIDRDLYILAETVTGVVLATGANPKLVGKDMINLKDADGMLLVQKMIDVAKTKGNGWIHYKWLNPVTQQIQSKSTYIEKQDDDFFIGCGVYN